VLLTRAYSQSEKKHQPTQQQTQQTNEVKNRLVERVCDTLRLVRWGGASNQGPNGSSPNSACYLYSFGGPPAATDDMDTGGDETPAEEHNMALELLRTCVTLLTTLLPVADHLQNGRDFSNALRRGGGVQAILSHLTAASTCAALSSGLPAGDRQNALHATKAIFCLLAAASTSSHEVATLLTEEGVQREICTNILLKEATTAWGELSQKDRHTRGYVSVVEEEGGGKKGQYAYLEQTKYTRSQLLDQVHSTWKLAIHTVSNLLKVGGGGFAAAATVDFLCTYAPAFEAGCSCGYFAGTRYTAAGLSEVAAVLELLSVVCGDELAVRKFQTSGGGLYERLLNLSIVVSRDVCAFLGSSTIARQVLGGDRGKGGGKKGGGQSSGEQQRKLWYGEDSGASENIIVSGQGVQSNRHDAISHAHHASGCIVAMTNSDKKLLGQEGGRRGVGSFDSDFGRKMETLASRCLFFSVAAISKAHPALKGFVTFSVRPSQARAEQHTRVWGSMMTYKTPCRVTIMRVAGSATSAMRKPQIAKRVRNDEA
jgi:hypothetical protein